MGKYELHKKLCDSLHEIYCKKNADYGDSFGDGFKDYGLIMPVIRLEDKLRRFKQLAKFGNQNVKDESIKDTLIDLANYAIMTVVELESAEHDGNEKHEHKCRVNGAACCDCQPVCDARIN